MIICAIQIGSSRILAIAASKDVRNGQLSNIQIESEPARDCISHGCITNVEQAAGHFRSLIQKLSNRMRATISSAYLGIGGMSLHSLIQLPSVQLPDYDVLASEAIDGNQYQLTIGQKHLRQRAMAAMERAGLRVADVIALPQATACILNDIERQHGCVLVDMGAGTTTVAIYKNNDLRHLAVIPLGGDSVSYDIQSAGCSYDDAERIKIEWSNVAQEINSESSANSSASMFADKALPFPLSKLNNIAFCRYEEIAANIQHQIEQSGLKGQLDAGCIVTGGAAMQSGLTALLGRTLGVSHVEIRAYSERALLGSERKPHLTNALALLSFCADDCLAPVSAPATSVAANHAASPQAKRPTPDGQITLDIPDSEPDTPDPTTNYRPDSHPIRDSIGRFVKDLFTGQK